MTWANPMLLLWGLVVVFPILLHFRMNRQPVMDRILPTFRFLSSSSFKAVRNKKIQEWLILLLRVLLLLGFSCLLARPSLPNQQTPPLDRIALILDDSLSTRYELHGRSLFQQIRLQAQVFLKKIPLSIPVGLYFTNGDFVHFTLDRARLFQHLNQERSLTHAQSYAALVHEITQQFTASEQGEIILFTDRTYHAFEGMHSHPFLKFVDCGLPDNPYSASIMGVQITNTGSIGKPVKIEFSGHFYSTQAFLKINGNRVQSQQIEPPFQEKYQFEFVPTTFGVHQVEVSLDADPLNADHHWYGAFQISAPPKVLLVGTKEQTYFLEKGIRVAGGVPVVIFPQQLEEKMVVEVDLVCWIDSPLYSPQDISIFQNYVNQKKMFWYFPGLTPFSWTSLFSWTLPSTPETGLFSFDFQNPFLPEDLLFLTQLHQFYPVVVSSENTKCLLRLRDGQPLVIQEGQGIWFGFPPTLVNESFLFSPLFPIFLNQLFHLLSVANTPLDWPLGTPYPLPWEQKNTSPIRVLLPDGQTVFPKGNEAFSHTEQLGFYQLSQENKTVCFYVNPNPNEFDLKMMSLADLMKKFGTTCLDSRYDTEEKEPEEWASWIAYVLILILVSETLWSNRIYKCLFSLTKT